MRVAHHLLAATLALVAGAALAVPPVTQDEAVEFHRRGLCVMAAPGSGIHGARGWLGAYLPGRTRLVGARLDTGEDVIDAIPGRLSFIVLDAPGAVVTWCPLDARRPGRDQCGPVPPAFLYDPS